MDPSSEHKAIPLSEENFISDESKLSKDPSATDSEAITEKVPEDSGDEKGEIENPTEETTSEEVHSPETPCKEEENLEDSANSESSDLSDQTLEVNLEEQPDSLASVVEMPKLAKRGTRKTASKTTRTRKKQPAMSDASEEEQSSSKLEAEVSEINSSMNRNANVSDDQVELQPDEKTVASNVS